MYLYKVTQKYREALDRIEIDEETGEVLNFDEIETVQAEFEEKAENVALYIKNTDAMIRAIREERNALDRRAKLLQKKSERLSEYLIRQMQNAGRKELDKTRVKLKLRASKRVIVTDEDKLPMVMMREKVTFEPDKEAIKEAITSGQQVEGAFIEEKYNLNIK